jgi:serine/threonine protein kinase
MGNAQKRCYEIKSKLKKKTNNLAPITSTIDVSDSQTTIMKSNSHKINIHIKKTRNPSLDKKNFLSGMSMHKHENISNITTNRTNRLMNSFNIFNSPRRFQSPENLSNINKKINLMNDYSPLKKYKKSNTIKNIYLKGDLIGEGRFGKVYPGLCTINGEIVTLKVYDKIPEEKKRLILKNRQQIYKLEHPNIVKTILLYEEKEQLNAIFDCSNLNSVQELLNEYGTFDENVIQKYSRQLLQGLKYLHEQNIYHKNFTPNNILVDAEGTIKISDCFIDSIILGSAKEIYDNLLSDSNDNINYYIPPFFIQSIFYFGESMTSKINENNGNNNIKIFEEWQAFDLWYMGCFLIEISSGKKPWNHYNFKDNSDFFEFLKSTHLFPTIPKKRSLEFQELVQILLNPTLTNKKNIYDIIFNLNFFTKNVSEFNFEKNNKSMMAQSSFRQSRIEKKIFEDSSYFADSNIQLGQMLQNNKVKNILNNNNNASFSVSSMEDISFSNSNISNINNNNFFGSINYSKNEFKSFIEGKINKIKSIKTIKSDMTEVKELQIE